MNKCIGLFGTCGDSKWRIPFMDKYDELGIKYFNPQVENWTPECAQVEAEHLASDSIVLFPVTNETYAFGSLAEIGFAIVNAIKSGRHFIIMIDKTLNPERMAGNPPVAKDSLRTRKLVIEHLAKLDIPNVHVVDSLDAMLEASLSAWRFA